MLTIEFKKKPADISVKVLGHTKRQFCNSVSCLLWSLLSWAENSEKASVDEYNFKSGDSYIKVKGCSEDIADFIEWAFLQLTYNDENIVYRITKNGETVEHKKDKDPK